MAKFIGTDREYHDFIGPRIRNVVQRITLTEKRKCNNTCAHCKKENVELESAHIHGNERKKIVDEILAKYKVDNHYEIDIGIVEEEIIKAHYPINENFVFLCRACHQKYDSKYIENDVEDDNEIQKKNSISKSISNYDDNDLEVQKVRNRLPNWFNNKNQYNSKILYAFLRLYDHNEKVTYEALQKEANFDKFVPNFNQMKNFGKQNHGKIFEQKGDYVYLWDNVKDLVISTYKKYKK